MKINRTPESFSIDDTEFATLMGRVLSVANQPIIEEINRMSQLVDDLVAKVQAETTQSAGLRVIIQQAIAEMVALKKALTDAIANSGISAADAAKLQAVVDSAGTDTALDATAAQDLTDAIQVNAPSN